MIRKLFDLKNDRFGTKTIFHVVIGLVIAIVASVPASLVSQFLRPVNPVLSVAAEAILNITVTCLLVRLYIVKGFKLKTADFRICKASDVVVWALVALALPLVVSCFFVFLTPGTIVSSGLSNADIIQTVAQALFTYCLTAGIVEELIFRGFIMRLLEIRWNKFIAILFPSALFGILHIFNMENYNTADVLLLLVAGTAVGIMFSLVAYQSGSVWASSLVHGIWNFCIIGGILEISANSAAAIFTYTLEPTSTLITGGSFGIESSLPAVIGYLVVIFMALGLQRRRVQAE